MAGTAVVFVHGFLSSARVWSNFRGLIRRDEALGAFETHAFTYATSLFSVHPLRQVPTFDEVADSLRTFLRHDLADRARLVLVSHSQGGLVVQRALARMLADGGDELARIRLVVMYACPSAGSDLGLPARRLLVRNNPQERELRPLNAAVLDAQRVVLHRIVHAPEPPLRVLTFAGESDGVVPPASARSVFPDAGVIPGDHSSIVQPESPGHRSYVVLRQALLALAASEDRPAGGGVPAPRAPADPPTPQEYGELVDLLLAVPGMADPTFRAQVYAQLPPPVQAQLPRGGPARLELIGVTGTLWAYRHLCPGRAFGEALALLVPGHPVLADVQGRLAALDGPGCP
ncbi:alpha/beta hydrolase [Micromonospora sp. NPDC005305]|uniref:esterase/lipase family protein n=1 Tax=Micromonospora sp. NPDC005305 TaxID=3156875 RepID=UPI0033A691FF